MCLSKNNFVKKVINNWYKIYLLLSIIFLVFILGILVGNYKIFPFIIFQNAKLAVEDLFIDKNYKHYANIRPEKFIHPSFYKGNGVIINNPKKAFDGYTLITSMWQDTSGLKLFDMDGTEIHKWMVSFNEIFPQSDSIDYQIADWDVDIHGSVIYPNGDIVFNFNGRGLVRIDKNSDVIWKLRGDYHHSLFLDEDDFLWVPGRITHIDTVKTFKLLYPPYYEDFICKISPNGDILEKFSLIEVFYNSGMEAILFADGSWATDKIAYDITHLNDIDILGSDLAANFPLFNKGDILLSMRHLNLIMVIDANTKQIKWSMTGPFIRQHDPDFMENGNIIVFDNRTDEAGGKILGGSRILEIDPNFHTFDIAYEGDEDNPFYTTLAGKQQLLPNGNILIAHYEGGRVFEVDKNGEIVWTFITRYDEDEVYSVSDAKRIPKDYLTFIN